MIRCWFDRNETSGALTLLGSLRDGVNGVDGLDGSMGIFISTNQEHLYVASFEDDSISWFDRNKTTGGLTYGGSLKQGDNGVDAQYVELSADGRFAYVTAEDGDSVSWFTRDSLNGALSYGSASDANYTLTAADAGSVITVIASYTDGGGALEQVHSAEPNRLPDRSTGPIDGCSSTSTSEWKFFPEIGCQGRN